MQYIQTLSINKLSINIALHGVVYKTGERDQKKKGKKNIRGRERETCQRKREKERERKDERGVENKKGDEIEC